MFFDRLSRFDLEIAIAGIVLLIIGTALMTIAINLYRKTRELLSMTAKSEEELEKKVREKTKKLSILHELTSVISQSLKAEEILKIVLSKVIEITGADIGSIHIVDSRGGFLNLIVSNSFPTELSMHLKKLKIGEGLASIAIEKKAIIGIDIEKYPQEEIGAIISKHGFQYMLSIPIVFKDIALGAITVVFKKQPSAYEEDALLRSIGMEIGIALNNAILFEKVENAKKEWEVTFDSIKDLIYIHDKDCRIIRCNTAFMEYVRSKPSEIIGKEYYKIFPKKSTPLDTCIAAIDKKAKMHEEITDKETGKVFLLDMYPVFDKNKNFLYSVHSAKDITEIKKAKADLEDLLISTITSLVSAIDAKSPWTKGHSERVTYYATQIGHELKIDEKDIETLTLAGLLHDIGKLGTYDALLDKPGRLTKEEFELVKKHPVKGAEILAPIKQLKEIIPILRHHHERYDGNGYPDGLKGDAIPFGARILCVADSFDAMIEERPYKSALRIDDARLELKNCSGTQFDPNVIEAFLNVVEENKFSTFS